jgi:transcription antitermination factor NusG
MCKYYVVRTNLRRDGQYAVIPNHQMRRFSALVSNGQDIIGEDELQNLQIVSGTLVHITDGLFKGYSGRVLKVRDPKKQRETTMLEVVLEKEMAGVLDKKIYITVAKEIVEKELGVK